MLNGATNGTNAEVTYKLVQVDENGEIVGAEPPRDCSQDQLSGVPRTYGGEGVTQNNLLQGGSCSYEGSKDMPHAQIIAPIRPLDRFLSEDQIKLIERGGYFDFDKYFLYQPGRKCNRNYLS